MYVMINKKERDIQIERQTNRPTNRLKEREP